MDICMFPIISIIWGLSIDRGDGKTQSKVWKLKQFKIIANI